MEHLIESAILDKMLEPVARCWTPSVAQQIAVLRADSLTQARIDELATKCNEGELTDAEQREYEAYVEALELIGLLQAKPVPSWPSSRSADGRHRSRSRPSPRQRPL
jgi:hypothetical protein